MKRVRTAASKTASYTCLMRACAYREKDACFRGSDHMAKVFIPLFARLLILEVPPLRRLFLRRIAPPGAYEYVLARTLVFDDVFRKALEDGFAQIVLLGAGFDTRAWRFRDRNRGARVFELDAPPTQRAKTGLLRKRGVGLPDGLVFVPIDFDAEGIADALAAAGYRQGQKGLFLWEGVTMYLRREAVMATLRFVRDSAAEGSILAFDYVTASVLQGDNRSHGEAELAKTVSRAGEGWTFGLEEGEVGQLLSANGLELTSHFTPEELQQDFLTADDGTTHGQINGTHCIAVARVS